MDRTALDPRVRKLLELAGWDAIVLADNFGEPLRVITIRLPGTYHSALRFAAHAAGTSMNRLCIARLMLDDTLADACGLHVERQPPTEHAQHAQGAGQSFSPQPLSVA